MSTTRKRAAKVDALTPPPRPVIREAVARALAEDLGGLGDVTSAAAAPEDAVLKAAFVSRGRGRVAGLPVVQETFAQIDPAVSVEIQAPDGADLNPLDVIARIEGPAHAILAGERTALNFLTRLSGIATLTAAYVAAVDGTMARIVGTRKTTPGLRALEHYAIRAGGGGQHRASLSDAVLVKDNHIAAAGGLETALLAVRGRAGHMLHVAVEVDTLKQLDVALRYTPDVVLLDNFALSDLTKAVRLAGGRCVLEASGGVTLETVRAIADTGVDVISVGALTHSAPGLDIGLDAY